ncbi:uncharacterized protein LOC134539829 isoform X4 [Bacillus rossius redtenbacheri]|uniref:uncharacterized protein LOC134539829 isoform X4 n=1 Tax=Bacillus rossius redtenbacheri TaxID=93214 RepID=UPI002FDE5FED
MACPETCTVRTQYVEILRDWFIENETIADWTKLVLGILVPLIVVAVLWWWFREQHNGPVTARTGGTPLRGRSVSRRQSFGHKTSPAEYTRFSGQSSAKQQSYRSATPCPSSEDFFSQTPDRPRIYGPATPYPKDEASIYQTPARRQGFSPETSRTEDIPVLERSSTRRQGFSPETSRTEDIPVLEWSSTRPRIYGPATSYPKDRPPIYQTPIRRQKCDPESSQTKDGSFYNPPTRRRLIFSPEISQTEDIPALELSSTRRKSFSPKTSQTEDIPVLERSSTRRQGYGSGTPRTEDIAICDQMSADALQSIGRSLWRDPRHSLTPTRVLETPELLVTVYRIPRDGDSLFAALAHQVFGDAVGSGEHGRSTASTREAVASLLAGNMERYADLVLQSVCPTEDGSDHSIVEEEKLWERVEELRTRGSPGGPEVIQLVADAWTVDVAVFSEGEGVAVVRSAETARDTIGIAESLFLDADGVWRSHFDSVKEVQIKDPYL